MIAGLNTDIAHDGVDHHVQTEDLGTKDPAILTLVYARGAIVLRQRLDYGEILGDDPPAASVKALMEAQHRQILGRVAIGDIPSGPAPCHDAPAPTLPGPPGPAASKSVEALIEEYLRARQRARAR